MVPADAARIGRHRPPETIAGPVPISAITHSGECLTIPRCRPGPSPGRGHSGPGCPRPVAFDGFARPARTVRLLGMAADGGADSPVTGSPRPPADPVAVIREILAVIPAGCTWVLPVTDGAGHVTDFRIEAVSGHGTDVYAARLADAWRALLGGR